MIRPRQACAARKRNRERAARAGGFEPADPRLTRMQCVLLDLSSSLGITVEPWMLAGARASFAAIRAITGLQRLVPDTARESQRR